MARLFVVCLLLVSCLSLCSAGAPRISMVSPSVGEQGEKTVISLHLTSDVTLPTKVTSEMLTRSKFEEDTLVVAPNEVPAKCKFDSEVVDGEYVPPTSAGAARVLCQAPALDVGVAAVSVSLDGQLFSDTGATFTTLYVAGAAKAAGRRLLSFEEKWEEKLLGLPEKDNDRDLMSTSSNVDQSFYGGAFYGTHGRHAMEDDELLFTEERNLLQEGLGAKPSKDFDVCAFAISPEYGPSAGHIQVTIGLAGSIPEDHSVFFCKFGDLVFKALTVSPPDSGEGPTMITCPVPPQVGSERVVVRISPDGSHFSAGGPTFTYTANTELYGSTTDVKFTYLPFSVDNCVFYDSSADAASTLAGEDEAAAIAAEAAAVGEGASGAVDTTAAGFEHLHLGSSAEQQQRRRRSLIREKAAAAASEEEEIAREERQIGEGVSGAVEGLLAEDIAAEAAAVGEGLSGDGGHVTAVMEIHEEEQAIGEGLSGAVELSEEEEMLAEERAIGDGLSGDAGSMGDVSLDAAAPAPSIRAEMEEDMTRILEGVSGDAAAIRAVEAMEAGAATHSFQARLSANVGKALRYARSFAMKTADNACSVTDSVEAVRTALSDKLAALHGQDAATSTELQSAVCSLADLTTVPSATWTASRSIVELLEAAFAAAVKPEAALVANIQTAECAVSLLNDVLVAEETRSHCLGTERDAATMSRLLELPTLVGRAALRSQRAGMPGLAAQRAVLTLVAAKVGGNPSESSPAFSARTGAHTCSVTVSEGALPAGAEFDAVMATFTAVTPLFTAAPAAQGSLSTLAVEFNGEAVPATVDIAAAAGAAPAEIEAQAGLRVWADQALVAPRPWLSVAAVSLVAKYALLPVCVAWLVMALRQRRGAQPLAVLRSPLIKSEV